MFRYLTLDDFDFNGKVVGVRVDINSPQIDGKIVINERIVNHSKTIKELVNKGSKVIVLAHQGRKGKDDCVSLKEHATLLEKELGKKVEFISELYSENVVSKISSMGNGDVLLLENLRFYDDEKSPNSKNNLLVKLEKHLDFYVFDAFSVSHREQTSVVGFNKVPNVAGRIMEKELLGLNKILETKSPHVFVFGGAKPDDLVELLESDLKKGLVDIVLLSGVIGEVALHVKGYYLGKKLDFLKNHDFLGSLDRIKALLDKYGDKIILPGDVALVDNGKRIELDIEKLADNKDLLDKFLIQDIGGKSIEQFDSYLSHAGSIYFKGPAGNFEEKYFDIGTKGVLKSIISSKDAFTFMGGGHSVTAAKMFGYLDKFSYISLAGGALVTFLSGKRLYGVESLESSFRRFDRIYEDFVVVGSNTLDTGINVPRSFIEVNLGDKVKVDEDFKSTVGGGGVNVSICLSRLGAKVGYLGKVSYESLDKIKEALDKNGIVMIDSKLTKKPCAKSILLDTNDHDRVIFTYRGQNSYLSKTDFDMNSFKSNNFYLSSLMGESFKTQLELVKKIKKVNSGSIFCYNTSSYLIKNEPMIRNLIKSVDILVLNYDEAQMLAGKEGISQCLREIRKLVSKVVVITDGQNGAFAFDGEKEYFAPSTKPKKVVDTTGAGDCFAGTFFYFYIKGFGIKKSMEFAAINAASVISKKGAQDGLMYYDDLLKIK